MNGIAKRKFPKAVHLRKRAEFQRVYKQGKRHFSGNMTVFYLRIEREETSADRVRIGFTVPRALGKAVDRNRIRRRVREAVRRHLDELQSPPVDVVINPKRTARDADIEELCQEIARAFQVISRNACKMQAAGTDVPRPRTTGEQS